MRNPLLPRLALALTCVAGLAAQSITVTPNAESLPTGGAKQFTATVSGLVDPTVTWSVNGVPGGAAATGTISSTGLFTAPAAIPSPNPVTVTATSVMSPTVTGSANITVKLPGATMVSVTPNSLVAGAFNVTFNGSGFLPGVVAYNGMTPLTTTYISPTQIQAAGSVSAGTAFFRALNPNSMFSNIVSVPVAYPTSSGTLTVTPSAPIVLLNGTQAFSASLNGSPATVTWSVSGGAAYGTITAAGVYTAPAALPSPSTATILATDAYGSAASATVTLLTNTPPVVSQVNPSPIPLGAFTASVTGSGFISQTVAVIDGAVVPTRYVSPTQLTVYGAALTNGTGTLMVKHGPLTSNSVTLQYGAPNPLVSAAAARRFLQQAAFGPTPQEVTAVQSAGFQAWLNQQFTSPKLSHYQNIPGNQGYGMSTRFLTNAVMNSDQLRQRVAFALEQIFVVSQNKLIWNASGIPYHEMMLNDAFSNYRQILEDVTLSPAMGYYLDMANNARGNSTGTTLPNENYAREVLQLFSIGAGNYDQTTIANFARVFTGWTYAPTTVGGSVIWGAYINPNAPMVPYAPMHDSGPKTLLNGVTLPAGQTPQKDLADALDNIFNHPAVGPFIGRQMIQHLVKFNPSPAYVARVAAAFADNGQGVRGDMRAVIAAVLLDPEARQNDDAPLPGATDGHLQEPALYLAGLLRAFNASVNDQHYLASELANQGQDVFTPPSVFSFYRPDIGEFQIYTPPAAVSRANLVNALFSAYNNPIQTYGPGTTIDLTAYVNLAATPAILVDAVDAALMRGKMPSSLKQSIVTAVQNDTGGTVRQTQTAIYLTLLSGYYNVWH